MVNERKRRPPRGQGRAEGAVPGWYAALEACRHLASSRRAVTAGDLASATGFSKAVASAWCSKFVAWGYLELAGVEGGGRGRARNVYRLTEYGKTRGAPRFSRSGKTCPTCGQSIK